MKNISDLMLKGFFVEFSRRPLGEKLYEILRISGSTAKSKTGLIFGFGVRKEWWITKKWGLGGMVYLFTDSIDDQPM